MLELDTVHTYYGASHILQGVSFSIGAGEVVAMLGRNGAGKTTTIRTIVGWTPPRSGQVRFERQELSRLPAHHIVRRGIGLAPQGWRIFRNLSVRENLTLGMRPGEWTLARVYELFPRLRERERHRGSQLSGGEQQMVAIARALLLQPRLLLLDEASEGLAPLLVREIGAVLRRLRETGLSILLVEQNLSLALGVATRVIVLARGSVVFEGAPDILRQDLEVQKRFLGV
ncbi:MAG: ABC transporter ATP-binding protein [Chloroflexales bacterium]|nr:ABC transporter ATP-binding protein [Chloroflexales bacterium]